MGACSSLMASLGDKAAFTQIGANVGTYALVELLFEEEHSRPEGMVSSG